MKAPNIQLCNPHNLFSESTKPSIGYLREEADNRELVHKLYQFIYSYPKFHTSRARQEPNYIRNAQQEMEDHHEQVKILAKEIFTRLGIADHQRTMSMDNIL